MSRPVHRLTARSLRVGANGTKAEFTGLDREYLGPFAQDRFFGVICNGRGLQPWNLAQEGDNPSDSSVNRGVDLDSDLLVWGGQVSTSTYSRMKIAHDPAFGDALP